MHVLWATPQSQAELPPVAVIVHAHYPDVAVELLAAVDRMGVAFDLFVTTSRNDVSDAIRHCVMVNARTVTVFDVDNIGRDVLPFVRCLDTLDLTAYKAVLKLHTKKTVGETYGDVWRDEIINHLIPGVTDVTVFFDRFDSAKWGVLGPSPFLLTDPRRFWGANRARTNSLRRRFGFTGKPDSLEFFAGTMFWFRPAALGNLAEIVRAEKWENERGQLDGTLAHAVERVIVDVARANGYAIGSSDTPYRALPDAATAANTYPGLR
jgi:rhamnosyltransferase